MKKWNEKTKGEQMFILCMLFMLALGLVCITGCGGSSCEKPKCASEEDGGVSVKAVSVPGCGGCITSEKGCDSILWPQSCKLITYSNDAGEGEDGCFIGCDIRYFGDGRFGCGQREQSCYNGCACIEGENGVKGCFYGDTEDNDETIIGCAGNGGGCKDGNGISFDLIYYIESALGVE